MTIKIACHLIVTKKNAEDLRKQNSVQLMKTVDLNLFAKWMIIGLLEQSAENS